MIPSETGISGRLVQRRPQQADLDEVVKVARLEAGILSVIGEAQELTGTLGQISLAPEFPDGRERQDRRRRAPPLGAECR